MVPLLLLFAKFDQRQAAATSLFAVIPTAIAGSASYLSAGHLDLVAALLIGAGGVGGSLLGTKLLHIIPLVWLQWLFIAVLVGFSLRLVLSSPERAAHLNLDVWLAIGLVVLGFATGVASGLFGIGGGVILVPVLIGVLGAGDLVAKGTALLAMIPTSAAGSVANLRSHLVTARDGISIGAGAAVGAIGGSLVAFAIPPRLSVILFAALVLVITVQLVIRAIRRTSR
jgi:uncharacterized membrane protein YfcA